MYFPFSDPSFYSFMGGVEKKEITKLGCEKNIYIYIFCRVTYWTLLEMLLQSHAGSWVRSQKEGEREEREERVCMGMQEHEMNEKKGWRMTMKLRFSPSSFLVCLLVGFFGLVFLKCCACKRYMACIYHVSVMITYTWCKKYFINLRLYISCIKKLELHIHDPMYFVWTM